MLDEWRLRENHSCKIIFLLNESIEEYYWISLDRKQIVKVYPYLDELKS